MFWAADPKFFLYAERRAASIASMRTSLPSPFSSSSCLMALMSSALFTDHSPPSPRALRRAFGSLQIFAQIRHLHHEPGLGDRLVVQTDFPPVVQSDRHPAVHQPEQAPPEPRLPLPGLVRRDGDRPPRKPHEVGQTAQRPVESRRRHLQRIGLHRQIVQVQFPAQRFAEPGAVADTRAAVPIHEHPQDLTASRADQLHVHDLQAHPRQDWDTGLTRTITKREYSTRPRGMTSFAALQCNRPMILSPPNGPVNLSPWDYDQGDDHVDPSRATAYAGPRPGRSLRPPRLGGCPAFGRFAAPCAPAPRPRPPHGTQGPGPWQPGPAIATPSP